MSCDPKIQTHTQEREVLRVHKETVMSKTAFQLHHRVGITNHGTQVKLL